MTSVQLDALAYLQIMKHGSQMVGGQECTGQLLGLDEDTTVHVTQSFPWPQQDQEYPVDSEQHTYNMLLRLREVNVDSHIAGWYNTTHLGQFFSTRVIDTQFVYQNEEPRAVLLIYDQLQSAIGKTSFKALQLTDAFMTLYSEANMTGRDRLSELPSSEMFREIPVTISASVLAENFLVDWAMADPASTTSQVAVLDVENQAFMEKNMQLLTGALEDLAMEQLKLMNFERSMTRTKGKEKGEQKGGGKGRPPRQIDTMIISQQIKNHCAAINNFATDSFGKVYLMSNKPGGSGSK